MQDSNIVFKVTTVGVEEATAKMNSLGATITKLTYNANGTVTASGKLTSTLNSQSTATNRATGAIDRASRAHENYFVHIAKTTVQSALVNKAFLGLVDAAGKAVKQVDLFNNFPASMQALGLSGKDASESFQTLRNYIAGVGGDLTTATTSVARFAEVTKNIKAATAEFVGVNNALIAGGAGAEVQKNALEQLIQAYSRGKPQLIEWRSLMVAMPAQLNQVAKAMGEPSAQVLGEQLTAGKISMQDFLTELTKLSTGSGPIAKQAIARMQGIQFASNVLENTLTNGLAAIYQAVGRQNIIAFLSFLTQVIQVLTSWAVTLINVLITLFNWISKIFGGPQISHFTGEAQGASDALGSGADNAKDLGDNLDKANGSAQKLRKGLAAFDKMNVLADKTSGDTGSGSPGTGNAGQTGLDPATAGKLEDIFGKIGGGLKAATAAAKIFAGIIAGLATNALISKLFGVNPLKSLISGISDASKGFFNLGKQIEGVDKDASKAGDNIGKTLGTKLGEGARSGVNKIGSYLSGAIGGIAATIGGAIAGAVADAVVAGAAALGVSVAVFIAIIAAAVIAIVAIVWLVWKNWNKIWGFIKKSASDTWQFVQGVWDGITNFFVGLWQGVYNVFMSVVGFLKEWGLTILAVLLFPLTFFIAAVIIFVGAVIQLFKIAWKGVTIAWGVAVAFFRAIWNGITTIFSAVASWLGGVFSRAWDAIKNIWDTVSSWFSVHIIQPIVKIFTPVVSFLGGVFSKAWDVVKKIWSVLGDFFKQRWENLKANLSGVASWFKNIFQDAWNNVTRIFSGLWRWFKTNVWDKITGVFSHIGTTVSNAISGAFKGVINTLLRGAIGTINGFIDHLNGAIQVINKISPKDIKPVPHLPIPQLASGGVITQPTFAQIGENGAEAVVPLENNTEWIDKLAAKINNSGARTNPDIIPVTNKKQEPTNNITIHVSGVFATSTAEQKKVAELIAKHLNASLKSKGLQAAY